MIESRYSGVLALTCVIKKLNQPISLFASKLTTLFFLLLLSSCSSKPPLNTQPFTTNYSLENRIKYLTTIKNWQIKGKIAFLDDNERKSASLFWQNNPINHTEQLNLTTYLGINVLEVNLNKHIYTVKVDGQSYQDTNIDYILRSLTGYQLPSQALKSWIKAIPFSASDKIIYHKETQLPASMTSSYSDKIWNIYYKGYMNVNNIPLPKQLTIKQNNLTIKIVINQWTF